MDETQQYYAAGSRRPQADYGDFRARFGQLYPEGGPEGGFELPAGWRAILWRLSEELEPLGVEVDEVKEKYAHLRVSLKLGTVRAYQLIGRAETESSTTCQVCGGSGELCKIGLWLWTLCPRCHEERKR